MGRWKNECDGWDVQRWKKKGNRWKQFAFVVGSYAHFWSFGVHNNKNAKIAIEKLHRIAREKEAHRSEHIQRQKEEVELLKKT